MHYLKQKKVLAVLGLLVIVILIGVFKKSQETVETVTVSRGTFVKEVQVTGKVIAAQDVDLSFDTGGVIAGLQKKVGDPVVAGEVIATLNAGDVYANRSGAVADLQAAQAELDKLESSSNETSPEVLSAKRKAIDAILEAYTQADDAVRNKIDQVYEDADSSRPKIEFAFDDYELYRKVNEDRVTIGRLLDTWEMTLSSLSLQTYTSTSLDDARSNLLKIKLFADDVSRAVNAFKTSGGSLTQTDIDKYKADIASGRTNINASLSELTSVQTSVSDTINQISVQRARVLSASARVQNYDAQLSKMTIRAPFSGIVSQQDVEVGESVSAHSPVISLISQGFEIEAFVPEINIAGLSAGNIARITLDAYGDSVVFDAHVVRIDPAETIKDGVSTYKVRLSFDAADERIRSGMTANIAVEVSRSEGKLIIPERSISSVDSKKIVKKKDGEEFKDVEVTVTDNDSFGNVEVLSGLSEGDVIEKNPSK